MNIRQATEVDSRSLEKLINAAYKIEEFFVSGNRIHPEEITQYMKNGFFLVGEEAGTVLGSVYVEIKRERAYLGLLSVLPSFQGSGIGRKMVQAAEDFAKSHRCTSIDLSVVNLRIELPPFYRKLGYRETGEIAPFPDRVLVTDGPCYFVMMAKKL
jgi:ribosomal protein S18 acetylase RimI-like enzyme